MEAPGKENYARDNFTMFSVFCLAFIFLIFSCAQGVPQHRNEADILSDISKKVNDLWGLYGGKYPAENNADNMLYAICDLQRNPKLNESEPNISGRILFKQVYPQGKLEAHFDIKGFPLTSGQSSRAIHIHTYGDLSNGCDSAGGHYNPYSVNHPHHPGDFGNFFTQNGVIHQHSTNLMANLFGPSSIMGRSIVVHKLADDLGKGNNQASLENGNAGIRLACCMIGATSNINWELIKQGNQ
ncbi:extracellular superoxide dismutase [Cu-Zn]-like [Gastrophryne carolinensis]